MLDIHYVRHYMSVQVPCTFGLKTFSAYLKIFLKLGVSQACILYVKNKFNTYYRCIEDTLNASCALFGHLPNKSVMCPKRVLRCTFNV